jgi:hypothetical protein
MPGGYPAILIEPKLNLLFPNSADMLKVLFGYGFRKEADSSDILE